MKPWVKHFFSIHLFLPYSVPLLKIVMFSQPKIEAQASNWGAWQCQFSGEIPLVNADRKLSLLPEWHRECRPGGIPHFKVVELVDMQLDRRRAELDADVKSLLV